MNKSLLKIMLFSFSLCCFLSAKTHIDDQVDPSVAEKLAIEAMQHTDAVEVKAKKEVRLSKVNPTILKVDSSTPNEEKFDYYRALEGANKDYYQPPAEPGRCVDCQGQDCTGYESWVGDGYCDDGAWGMYFNCPEYDCDNGDCAGDPNCEGASDDGGTDGGETDGGADDGGADDGGADDGGSACDANAITLTVGGGSWDSEISWTIDLNEEFVASGGAPSTTELCLNDGDYTFSGCDSYGDGWNNATATASDAEGNVIFSWVGPTSGIGAGVCEAVTMSVGGAPPVGGCTDPNAPNYNADAEVDDGSCEDYCDSNSTSSCGYWLETGVYSCDELTGYGYDCSACEADGSCDSTSFTCPDGEEVDAPEDCSSCAFDWSAYGAESCDAAWDAFGIDCATLEANYGWNCAGCECPGDSSADGGDDGSDDGGDDGTGGCEWDASNYGADDCDAAWDLYGLDCATLEANYGWICDGCECPGDSSADDGGDDGSDDGGMDDSGDDGICYGLVVAMFDSYGDGWNGNVLTIGDQTFELDPATDGGSSHTACYENAAGDGWDNDVIVTCDGGSWQSEVSWALYDYTGSVVLDGGAPYQGCLGNCDSVVFGCTDEGACNYNPDATDDDGTCDYGDCNGDCDGTAVVDDCGECGGDGSACADCYNPSWYADGYCDSSNNTIECGYDGGDCCPGDCVDNTYSCEDYGGDCSTCLDPDSADNQEGGQCNDYAGGCTDPEADNYDPDATEDDGSCIYGGCAAGTSLGCSDQDIADGDCASDTWIGDGICDGYSEAYGVNFCCYDNDGGDCTDAECSPPEDWDAVITGLTAEGTTFEGQPAIQWDWDDLEGTDTCGDEWEACLASLADYDAANGTTWASECAECADTCAQNPDVPELTDACMAAAYNIGAGTCPDPCGGGTDGGTDGGDDGGEGCADGSDPLYDCIGTAFCEEDCANTSYDSCSGSTGDTNADGEVTSWIGDGYCDDGSYGLEFACNEYDCDGCDCGSAYSSNGDGCNEGCTDPGDGSEAAECSATFTVAGSDGENDCYSDGSGYFSFAWEGGCLATSITYSAGELDLTSYSFTDGFVFYGFEPGSTEEFLVIFNADYDYPAVAEATSDCPAPETCEDNGLVTCPDGTCVEEGTECPEFTCGDDEYMCASGDQCIPASYLCDGSSEFCNASWGPDCADGSDEGLELCGYTDDCEGETDGGGDDGTAEGCLYDYTAYGAADCDAAWDTYGLDCATLEANYNWDCAGCSCPGDGAAGDDGAGDDGGDACADGTVADCSGDGDCAPESWIGDGWCDGTDQPYGYDLTCYENDAGDCDGRSSSNNKVLSVDNNVNLKKYSKLIAEYKASKVAVDGIVNAHKTMNNTAAMTINVLTGEVTYADNYEANRDLSYIVSISCDACLSGGPWSGTFETAESEFLVYGFDADSNACGSVVGIDTVLGATAESEAACANAGGEVEECDFFDCIGQEACGYESWLGDGYCDDGSWGMYFDCDEYDCDYGDCDTCDDGPDCTAGDVNGDATVNVSDIVVLVNYILGGGTGTDGYECGDMNGDGVINVSDIVQIVNYILGGGTARLDNNASQADVVIANNTISVEADGFVQGVQLTLTHGEDFSIDLADSYIADYKTEGNLTRVLIVSDGASSVKDVANISGECSVIEATIATPLGEAQVNITEEIATNFEVQVVGPNPFNPSTSLNVIVDQAGHVSVKIFNLVGQQVATIADGYMEANNTGYTFNWNASQMASGVYLVRAESAGQISTQKLMLLK